MIIPFLDLKRMGESLKDRLKTRFAEVLELGVFSGGQEVQTFENTVTQFLASRHAIACANGTDAVELALRAFGIGPGDEVIVPAMTWVSSAEAVVLVGAKPVFWDTDRQGLLRSDWEKGVSQKTKALIPVHLYGKMVEMRELILKAKSLGLYVIEDAAQAFGSVQHHHAAGTWGDVGCLSFYPTKNLGALGEAGMCLTQDDQRAAKIRLLLNHGQPVRDQHELIGRNSRIDTLQAAMLNVLMEDFQENQRRRKELAKHYLDTISDVEELLLPEGILQDDHNAHLFVVQTARKDELKQYLAGKGIGTAVHYPKILPDLEPYRAKGDFFIARKLAEQGLSLPLNPYMTMEEVDLICSRIRHFFQTK